MLFSSSSSSFLLFVVVRASNHNDGAVIYIYGPPAMVSSDLRLPTMPASALRETNRETLERLEHD